MPERCRQELRRAGKLTSRSKPDCIRSMIRLVIPALAALLLVGCAAPDGPPTQLERANVLPLAIDPDFQFRKVQQEFFDSRELPPTTTSEAAIFNRAYRTWGAIDGIELSERNGTIFNFFWRTRREADVTVRFEYRQAGLANHVLAKELTYPAARGSRKSTFAVTGDEYLENGRVSAWRALLIVDGRIVALRQSFMWR